ncbi:DUF6894 family protein [Microvirga calopogonii]|uniref:DUF6894 family protein n=1 Tax=Microvirga calopogonii TaxID=2078013 RepID=UPI000E0D1C82|nr:hypothetical protein [Microvirga calopogonii]
MPRFFFHLRGGLEGLSRHEIGVTVPDVEAAYLEAFQAATDMSQEWLKKGRNPRCYAFEIMNTAGELVLVLPFSEVLDRQSGRKPVRLSRTIRTAKERGERMTRLTTEVAEQVKLAQENLRRSRELLSSLGKSSAKSGFPL